MTWTAFALLAMFLILIKNFRLTSWNHFISMWILFAMDILREFLESSTIHGLSYISISKVRNGYLHLMSHVIGVILRPLSQFSWYLQNIIVSFRPSPSKYSGLLWSALVSWEQDCWSANRTRSGRSPRWPPRSPPAPSATWTSPSWPSALQRDQTLPFIMIL